MGNCQAVDAAALVVQHPNGKIERYYWPVPVRDVMKNNPGHYVSLIIPLPVSSSEKEEEEGDGREKEKVVRFTRVKLLRPTETLSLGHAYRLITSQEVMKVIRAKKYGKMKRQQRESEEKPPENRIPGEPASLRQNSENNNNQITKQERQGQKTGTSLAPTRSKSWRPSLQSISEASS